MWVQWHVIRRTGQSLVDDMVPDKARGTETLIISSKKKKSGAKEQAAFLFLTRKYIFSTFCEFSRIMCTAIVWFIQSQFFPPNLSEWVKVTEGTLLSFLKAHFRAGFKKSNKHFGQITHFSRFTSRSTELLRGLCHVQSICWYMKPQSWLRSHYFLTARLLSCAK